MFAVVGSLLVYISSAQQKEPAPPPPPAPLGYISNPPFAYTCGFNVMIYIDTSGSRDIEQVNLDKQHAKSFMNAFNGTDTLFLLSGLDDDVWIPYTSDKSKIVNALDMIVSTGGSIDIDLKPMVKYINYRPSKQTIIMIFTDGGDPNRYDTYYSQYSNQLKASGARIIAFVLTGGKINLYDVQKITGPNIDTGNILTSDVVHNSNYAALTAQLKQFATVDSCNPPPASSSGSGSGSNGSGNGSGNNGNGQGTNGTGTGSGGGGGGSSANQQDDEPNSLPTSGGQGGQDSTSLEPSPFFDGKEFKPGSDKDTLANTVSSTGKKLARTWPLITAVVVLGGIAGYGYWHKKRRPHS